jgi:uncharacterized protein
MRRSDREIADQEEMFRVIDRAPYCHLALAADDEPYLIPLSFGRDGRSIFFHTALGGEKIDFMVKNPVVRLAFECDVKLVSNEAEACEWSFSFHSVIARGRIHEVTDPDGKWRGLQAVMAHYSDREWTFPGPGVDRVRVWEILLTEMTGKRTKDKSDLG